MATAKPVDFSNVKDGGNFNRKRIPAGDYLATITKVDDAEAKDGVFQYLVSIKINKRPSSVLPYYCKLQENQLWKLRNLLIAGGLTVPKKRIKVDPNRLVNKQIGVTIEDDDFDGKEQSTIAGVFPAAELGDLDGDDETDSDDSEETVEDEPEEEAVEDDEEALEEDEAEEENEDAGPYADLDRTQIKAELTKLNPDFKAKKSQTDDDLRALLVAAAGGDLEEDIDEEEEEEVAPPKPTRTRRAAKKPIDQVSDEELEELDIDDI